MIAPDLTQQLRGRARDQSDDRALSTGDKSLSFSEVLAAAEGVAGLLRDNDVRSGARVAICMANTPDWAVAYFGVLLVGAIVVPLNPRHDGQMTATRLTHSETEVVVVDSSTSPGISVAAEAAETPVRCIAFESIPGGPPPPAAAATRDSDAPAVLSYGTHDPFEPAATLLSHKALVSAATAVYTDILRLGGDDIVLAGVPLMTVPGQTYCLNASMAAGTQLIVPAKADVDGLLRTIEDMKATVLTTAPLMLPALVRGVRQLKPDLGTLRTILVTGGSAVPARVRASVHSTFGCDLLECYGPPEFSSLACVTGLDGEHADGSVGKCVGSVEVAVEDADPRTGVGELLLRGDHTMLGFWNDRAATDRAVRDGWLRTGTGARVAPSGHVYLSEGGWMGRLTAVEERRPRLRKLWRGRR